MKVWQELLILLLAFWFFMCMCGCMQAVGKKTEYYPNGEIKSYIRICMTQCMTDSKRSGFKVDVEGLGKVELGSSVMNAEEFSAMIREANPILALLLGI